MKSHHRATRLKSYTQSVARELSLISSTHALHLLFRGVTLGWRDTVASFYHRKLSPRDCATRIVHYPLPQG